MPFTPFRKYPPWFFRDVSLTHGPYLLSLAAGTFISICAEAGFGCLKRANMTKKNKATTNRRSRMEREEQKASRLRLVIVPAGIGDKGNRNLIGADISGRLQNSRTRWVGRCGKNCASSQILSRQLLWPLPIFLQFSAPPKHDSSMHSP